MSIQKARPCKLKHEQRPYTMLYNKAIQECDDLLMIGLWTHFSTLPENWEIHVSYVCSRFHIGRDKAYSLLRKMEAHGLLKYIQNRDSHGRFLGTDVVILDGSNFTKEPVEKINNQPFPENQETESPFPEKPDTVQPDTVNRTHTNTTLLTNEIKEKKEFHSKSKNQKPESPLADVTKQSTSYGNHTEAPQEAAKRSYDILNYYTAQKRVSAL